MIIKAIGFDYGGVIDDIPGPIFKRNLADILGVDLKLLQYVYSKFIPLLNNNTITVEEFFKKIAEELQVSDKYGLLMEYVNNLPPYQINKQLLDLIDKLRANGYKVGILSNNTLESIDTFRGLGLFNHFDIVTTSAEIGYSKPDPQAFTLFAEKLGVKISELAFVDDTEKSVLSAEEVGFYPIVFVDYKTLIAKLISLGVKI